MRRIITCRKFSVGVYTSPHLLHYNERIQINGKPVSDELICDAFEKIADAAAEISLTYFEYGTLAALQIFKEQKVDFLVLEVGLGGRLDAINILDADIAIITSIALDHQDWLGDNREVIGREKAGILREQKIFICADENPPQTIIEIAANLKTISYFIDRDFSYTTNNKTWQWQGKNNQGDAVDLPETLAPHLPLPSMAAALQAINLLGIKLTPSDIENALLNLNLAGRFQKIIYQSREFILDVAHNPAATEYLAKRLTAEPFLGKTFAIVAMMADKDRVSSLANLTGLVDGWYLLELSDIPRAAPPQALSENLATLNVRTKTSGNIKTLIGAILEESGESDRILVFGSFFTVSAALSYLQTRNESIISRGIQ